MNLKLIAAGVLAAAAVAAIWHMRNAAFDAGVLAGRNQVLASNAAVAAGYLSAKEQVDAYAAAAGNHLQQSLGSALPTIQGQTHAAIQSIRDDYRAHPDAAAACRWPDGVRAQIDQAVDRANRAARGTSTANHQL